MDFAACLRGQLRAHPSMQPQDVIKLCYQAARGAEHLLSDLSRARAYFDREYAASAADASLPVFEAISPRIARVNLAAWKAADLPADWLFRMFADAATVPNAGDTDLDECIAAAAAVLQKEGSISAQDWEEALAAWSAAGRPAVHHSDAYRAAEHPAYRIVNRYYACVLPLMQALNRRSDIHVIAIDGRAASGKSTRALLLSRLLDAPVIHMDDFFLPPTLRTPERLAQPGGNVHYERFIEEVLPGLLSGEAFSCRIFDCSRMDYAGTLEVPAAPVRIVEGSYALHPAFGDYAQIKVFSDVSPDEQMARILRRNGERMAEMFRTRWIPMEEKYFSHCGIRDQADIIL